MTTRMPLKHWKKISEETIHANPWNNYKHDRLERGAGESGDYYYVDAVASVMIIPVTDDGKLLLVKQYRYLGDLESVEFPCGNVRHRHADGTVSYDEPLVTARRELAEECGVAGDLTYIGKYSPCNGIVKEWAHVFLGRNLRTEAAVPDVEEEFELLQLDPVEVDAKIASGEIWDGQTIVGWALARPHILK